MAPRKQWESAYHTLLLVGFQPCVGVPKYSTSTSSLCGSGEVWLKPGSVRQADHRFPLWSPSGRHHQKPVTGQGWRVSWQRDRSPNLLNQCLAMRSFTTLSAKVWRIRLHAAVSDNPTLKSKSRKPRTSYDCYACATHLHWWKAMPPHLSPPPLSTYVAHSFTFK